MQPLRLSWQLLRQRAIADERLLGPGHVGLSSRLSERAIQKVVLLMTVDMFGASVTVC